MDISEIRKEAPEGATHYRLNDRGVARYYRLDCNNDWIVFQDWQYPLRWQKSRKIDNLLPL